MNIEEIIKKEFAEAVSNGDYEPDEYKRFERDWFEDYRWNVNDRKGW